MEPKLFQFTSYPEPLWVVGGLCANPDCECGDVFIELIENDETRPSNLGRAILSMRFDSVTSELPTYPFIPLVFLGWGAHRIPKIVSGFRE
jgi:hypothetical protein